LRKGDDTVTQGKRPHVIILGAGFGGLHAARALAGTPVDVTLVDRNNYHTFFPLLYQVAAAEVEASEIAYPIRGILRKMPNVSFLLAKVEDLDLRNKTVKTSCRPIGYDYLIIAIGSVTRFFNVPGSREYSFRLKNLEEAIRLRNHIICCFEQAAQNADADSRRRMLTFTITGGGPTGVEYAGALSELISSSFSKDFPELDMREARVVLLEAQDGLLPGFPDPLRRYARRRLISMGVDVRLNSKVREVTDSEVLLADGNTIPTETVVWTAGVRGSPRALNWKLPVTSSGGVEVLPTLQIPGHPEVYVVGDLAHLETKGVPLPMVAPVAVQEGKTAAKNILNQVSKKPPLVFKYKDMGSMVTLGRNKALALVRGRAFSGFPAWILWLTVHLAYLIGFRNRLLVLTNWAWDYLFFEKAVRMMVPNVSVTHFSSLKSLKSGKKRSNRP